MMRIKKSVVSLSIAGLLCSSHYAAAQDVGSVNGIIIPDTQFNQALSSALNQGQKDNPELRNAIKDELINRELLAQASKKEGLDKTSEAKQAWAQVHQNFMIELFIADYRKKHPVTDDDVKAQYNLEASQLQAVSGSQQFKLSLITVATEEEANAVVAQLRKGASFEKVAREKSTDPSKVQGGMVGWFLQAQLTPEIASAISKVNKGGYTTTPIRTQGGWSVIKVDDKRPFKIPAYAEAQNQIRQQLLQQQQIELINKLRSEAKVVKQ